MGGLPHVRVMIQRLLARFRQPLLEWPTPEARQITVSGSSSVDFEVELLHAGGDALDPNQSLIQWSVVSGPVTADIFSIPQA